MGDTCSDSRRPALRRGLGLTLEAELIVCLAPEVFRLAVRRPQIRDVAMSPSTEIVTAHARRTAKSAAPLPPSLSDSIEHVKMNAQSKHVCDVLLKFNTKRKHSCYQTSVVKVK